MGVATARVPMPWTKEDQHEEPRRVRGRQRADARGGQPTRRPQGARLVGGGAGGQSAARAPLARPRPDAEVRRHHQDRQLQQHRHPGRPQHDVHRGLLDPQQHLQRAPQDHFPGRQERGLQAGAGPGVGDPGRPRPRLPAPQGRDLPQWRPLHGGRREVEPRTREGQDPVAHPRLEARAAGGDRDTRPPHGQAPLHQAVSVPARGLHRLHGTGRHHPQPARGQGEGQGLRAEPGGHRPLQVRGMERR